MHTETKTPLSDPSLPQKSQNPIRSIQNKKKHNQTQHQQHNYQSKSSMTIKYLSRKQTSKLNQKLTIIDKNHQK